MFEISEDTICNLMSLLTAPPATVVPDELDLLTCHLDGVTETYAEGWNSCRAAMLQGGAGNSPAIPDGYALVPVEPTAEMISSGIAAHYERSNIQIHDRPAPGPMECAYVAMLSAAPQQE